MEFKEGDIVTRFGRNKRFKVLGPVEQIREIIDKDGNHLVGSPREYRIQALDDLKEVTAEDGRRLELAVWV